MEIVVLTPVLAQIDITPADFKDYRGKYCQIAPQLGLIAFFHSKIFSDEYLVVAKSSEYRI